MHFRNRERISFDHLVSMKKAGETAKVSVMRAGQELYFDIKLGPVCRTILIFFPLLPQCTYCGVGLLKSNNYESAIFVCLLHFGFYALCNE